MLLINKNSLFTRVFIYLLFSSYLPYKAPDMICRIPIIHLIAHNCMFSAITLYELSLSVNYTSTKIPVSCIQTSDMYFSIHYFFDLSACMIPCSLFPNWNFHVLSSTLCWLWFSLFILLEISRARKTRVGWLSNIMKKKGREKFWMSQILKA